MPLHFSRESIVIGGHYSDRQFDDLSSKFAEYAWFHSHRSEFYADHVAFDREIGLWPTMSVIHGSMIIIHRRSGSRLPGITSYSVCDA